jgi:hypothetical protein
MKEMIPVERKKLEEIKAFVSPYDTARQLLDTILNPTPTMTKADWQRVIDEGFYVTAPNAPDLPILPHNQNISASQLANSDWKVFRKVGHRQPHFKEHSHPEGNTELFIMNHGYDYGSHKVLAKHRRWDDVREYIVL